MSWDRKVVGVECEHKGDLIEQRGRSDGNGKAVKLNERNILYGAQGNAIAKILKIISNGNLKVA